MTQPPQLTPEQQAILSHPYDRHARILAGPGTGKSFTSVALLKRYVEDEGRNVRMLSFTRAATAEIVGKLETYGISLPQESRPSTIHGFSLSVLSRAAMANIPKPIRIADGWEASKLIRPHISKLLRDAGHASATPSKVRELEREMSSGWESLDDQLVLASSLSPALRNAYVGTWNAHRARFSYALMGELPYRAGNLIEDNPSAATYPDVLIVDEYQDLNMADIRLLRLLARQGTSVIAVGDDDQSIYSFRMAAPAGIRNFGSDFENALDYTLSVSRRCTQNIISAANTLIETEPGRPQKKRLTPWATESNGTYAYLKFASTEQEARAVARLISSRLRAGTSPSDIGVLAKTRINVWSAVLQPELSKLGIAIASTAWVDDALSETPVRRAIALARVAVDQNDALAWWTILHLTPGVGPEFISYVYEHATDAPFAPTLLALFAAGFPAGPSSSSTAADAIGETLRRSQALNINGAQLGLEGWGRWLLDTIGAADFSDEARSIFLSVGSRISPELGLAEFLSQLGPLGADIAASKDDGVRMMTMVRSKGLTFDTAIVLGVEAGLVPDPRANIDEERRLLYVAMTRAQQMCVLTWSSQRDGQLGHQGAGFQGARTRSPLLADIPQGMWRPGPSWVDHFEAYGEPPAQS